VFRRRQREVLALGAVGGALLPFVVNGLYGYDLLVTSAIYSLLALGFYFQLALAGQFSLGSAAFYAIGAYTSVWASPVRGFIVGLVARWWSAG